jgi:hypothetical protein
LYREWSKGKDFFQINIFTKLESCPKWENTLYNLSDTKVIIYIDWDGPTPSSGASVGRPIEHKKAKAQRNGAASSSAMEASLNSMIAEVVASTKEYMKREMRRIMLGRRLVG